MDMPNTTLVMTKGIGANLTNDEKREHLIDLKREHLIDLRKYCRLRPRNSWIFSTIIERDITELQQRT